MYIYTSNSFEVEKFYELKHVARCFVVRVEVEILFVALCPPEFFCFFLYLCRLLFFCCEYFLVLNSESLVFSRSVQSATYECKPYGVYYSEVPDLFFTSFQTDF